MNKKKNFFVYDTSGGFSRFVTIKFGNQFKIDACKRETNFDKKFDGEYIAAFAVINKPEDLLIFSHLYVKVSFVFVISNMVDVNNILLRFNNVFIIDNKKTKQEIAGIISFQLERNILNQY